MSMKMTHSEKYERREARTLGGWTLTEMRYARLYQLRADDWAEEFAGEPERESARVWRVKAERAEAKAAEYATQAAHHARLAIELHEAQREAAKRAVMA